MANPDVSVPLESLSRAARKDLERIDELEKADSGSIGIEELDGYRTPAALAMHLRLRIAVTLSIPQDPVEGSNR
jgi:hypothetical protein